MLFELIGPVAHFKFNLEKHFTVIVGDSSTKKTYFCKLLEKRTRNRFIKVNTENVAVINDDTWRGIREDNKQDDNITVLN